MIVTLSPLRDRPHTGANAVADISTQFAFVMGIDRIAMLKNSLPDLRAFFESDLRWLRHYGVAALDLPDLAGGLGR